MTVVEQLHDLLGTASPLELLKKLNEMPKEDLPKLAAQLDDADILRLSASHQGISYAEALKMQLDYQGQNEPSVISEDLKHHRNDVSQLLRGIEEHKIDHASQRKSWAQKSRRSKWQHIRDRLEADLLRLGIDLAREQAEGRKGWTDDVRRRLEQIWQKENLEPPPESTTRDWLK